MSHIREVTDRRYESEIAGKRGRVANILKIHGIEPEIGRAHLSLYLAVMFGRSTVTRLEREAIAVGVSVANRCGY